MANPKKSPEKVEKVYLNTLASKELFHRVPSARKINSDGITMIKVPTNNQANPKAPDTEFRSVVNPAEVEQLILERNREHFTQAKDTPLASQVITDMIGFSGTTSIADRLLKGTIDVSSITTDKYGQLILLQCQRIHPELPAKITLDEFKTSYNIWRVGTSTSPSGRHLSHQHVLFQPHGIDPTADPKQHEEAEQARELGGKIDRVQACTMKTDRPRRRYL